jgi:hypothetical protein
MQLVYVIGRGIAGEADEVKVALLHFTQLLRLHRPPTHNGFAPQSELLQEPVGGCVRRLN